MVLIFTSCFHSLMMYSETDKDDDRGLSLFGDTHSCDEETLVSTLEGNEEVFLPRESPEPHKMMKYNLRKSLAWDKAFFTNAGKFLL